MKKLIILLIVPLFIIISLIKANLLQEVYFTMQRGNFNFLRALKKEKVYTLTTDKELEFLVPDSLEGLKLSLRPILNKSKSYNFDQILYKIHYRLEDRSGTTVEERDYWVSHYIDEDLITEAKKRFFFEDKNLQPTQLKPVKIVNSKKAREGKLYVKLITTDSNVNRVLINAKYQEKLPVYRQKPGWERMPLHLKEKIKDQNIYEIQHLSKNEKRALTLNKWRPIAPTGVAKKDFQEHMFFEDTKGLSEIQKDRSLFKNLPKDGVVIGPNRDFTTTITNPNVELVIKVTPTSSKLPEKLRLTWYGREVFQIESSQISVKPVMTIKPKPGLLVISSESNLFIQVTTKSSSTVKYSSPRVIGAFTLNTTSPIKYNISRVTNSVPVYKFNFTIRANQFRELVSKKIHLKELNSKGTVIKEHHFNIPAVLSTTDFELKRTNRVFSKPLSISIYPEKQSAYFEIFGEVGSMVKTFSRIKDHAKINFVPDDFFRKSDILNSNPLWFTVNPKDKKILQKEGRLAFYNSQRKIPEREDYLIKGQYDLVSFRPKGKWSGQYFLIEMMNPNYQAEPSSFVYGDIAINKNININFNSKDSKSSFRPTLVIKNLNKNQKNVKIYVDGKIVKIQNTNEKNLHISLPSMKPSLHSIKIEAPIEAKAYLNYHKPQNKTFLKKLAYRLDQNKSLTFNFNKRIIGKEANLSVRVFQIRNRFEHTKIKTSLTDNRVDLEAGYDSFTTEKSEWNISPQSRGSSLIFNNHEEVSEGTPFSLIFGQSYNQKDTFVSFDLEEGELIYICLIELAPIGEVIYNENKTSSEEDL